MLPEALAGSQIGVIGVLRRRQAGHPAPPAGIGRLSAIASQIPRTQPAATSSGHSTTPRLTPTTIATSRGPNRIHRGSRRRRAPTRRSGAMAERSIVAAAHTRIGHSLCANYQGGRVMSGDLDGGLLPGGAPDQRGPCQADACPTCASEQSMSSPCIHQAWHEGDHQCANGHSWAAAASASCPSTCPTGDGQSCQFGQPA